MRQPLLHGACFTALLFPHHQGARYRAPCMHAHRSDATATHGIHSQDSTASPLPRDLDGIITRSLDRHAQRLQRVLPGQPPPDEVRQLRLLEASADDWRLVIDALAPFIREQRVRSMERALRRRRRNLHLVVENLADPYNAQSVCRTAEALGVQNLHVIESVSHFQLPSGAAHATARGALGRSDGGEAAGRWLTVHKHADAAACVAALRERRVRVFVSDCPTDEDGNENGEGVERVASGSADGGRKGGGLGAGGGTSHEGMGWVVAQRAAGRAVSIEALGFADAFADGFEGAALVFGNERRGVSRVLSESADAAFYLPMSGFTQSFNVGVALAMSLHAAVGTGLFPTGTLDDDEQAELLGRWLLRDIKAARGLLLQAGLEFEDF